MMTKNQCSLPQIRDPFQHLFSRLLGDPISAANDSPNDATARSYTPRTNISETDKAYVLAFDLPGVTEQDIQVELQDHVLKVSAERKDTRDAQDEGTRWHRLEHRFGQDARAFPLPKNAAPEGIEAVCQAGVLTVTVPKREEAKPAKITVRTA